MRILWFTNTASLSADYLNKKSIGGGWISSLETELCKISSIELAVCFNLDHDIKPFIVNKTTYYPVHTPSPNSKIKKLISRWAKPVQNENDIQPYLNIIEEFKPDVIHIFGTEGVFGLIISRTKVPCVIHLQGVLVICDQKWHSGVAAVDILKYSKKWELIKGFGIYHNYWLNKKEALRERKIFQQCNYFMGRTDWDRRITSVLSANSTYFHCDEMMRPEFYSYKWVPQINKINFTLITTIRNNIYKGLETIFECKRILNNLDLKYKITWKIAGITETDEIANILERKYRSTFKENGICLLGSLQQTELINEMLNSDIFIHPSHIENGSNSTSEAMLLGMPVIATFAGGIPSTVENKKEGLLVQDGDPYALAGAILELKEDTNYAHELGNNARVTARIRHDPAKIMSDLLNIYSSITSHNADNYK